MMLRRGNFFIFHLRSIFFVCIRLLFEKSACIAALLENKIGEYY